MPIKKVPVAEDTSVTVYKDRGAALVSKFEGREIKSSADMEEAVTTLSSMNKIMDAAEEEKQKVLTPINAARTAELKRWKPIETFFDGAILALRGKITAYQTTAKREADEEAAKIAARVGEGKGKLRVETAVGKIAAIEKPADNVATEAGKVRFKTVKKFEVMDISLLPIEYHLANETAIRASMNAGTELAGVRYYTEEQPINFR